MFCTSIFIKSEEVPDLYATIDKTLSTPTAEVHQPKAAQSMVTILPQKTRLYRTGPERSSGLVYKKLLQVIALKAVRCSAVDDLRPHQPLLHHIKLLTRPKRQPRGLGTTHRHHYPGGIASQDDCGFPKHRTAFRAHTLCCFACSSCCRWSCDWRTARCASTSRLRKSSAVCAWRRSAIRLFSHSNTAVKFCIIFSCLSIFSSFRVDFFCACAT